MYDLTNLTNANSFSDLIKYSNEASEVGGFGVLTLIVVGLSFVFLIIMVKNDIDFDKALLSTSFVSFLLSALLAWGGYVNISIPVSYLAIVGLTFIYTLLSK